MKARRSDPLSTSRRRRVLAFGGPSIASSVRASHAQATTFSRRFTPPPLLCFFSVFVFSISFENSLDAN
jgi:hypothetical protein